MTPKLPPRAGPERAAMPNPPITTPPSAGPIALLMLMPTLLLATAAAKSCASGRAEAQSTAMPEQ